MVMWAIKDLSVMSVRVFVAMGFKVGVANIFLSQSIGIDMNNSFQFKFSFYH